MLTKLANLCNNLRHGNYTNKLTQWGVDRLKFQLASHPTVSYLERFSIECRKSKNQNNHDCQSKGRKIPLRANENSTWKQANCLKRGKPHLYCFLLVERVARVFWTNHREKSTHGLHSQPKGNSLFWGYAVVTAKHLVLCLFLGNCFASDHDLRGERQALQWPTPLLIRKSLTPLYHLPLWSASGIWPVGLSILQVCGNQTRWLAWPWWLPLRRDDNILVATEGAANKVNHYKKKGQTLWREGGHGQTIRYQSSALELVMACWHSMLVLRLRDGYLIKIQPLLNKTAS